MKRDHASGSSSPAPSPFVRAAQRRVRGYAQSRTLFAPGVTVVVMVSGGQDSTCLLHLLASGALPEVRPEQLYALHVNHRLRGAESEADERLVEDLCRRLTIPLTVVAAPLSKGEGNLQSRARDLRRRAALELAEELSPGDKKSGTASATNVRIALGHTLDDQVETMLYRMGRYAGLAALSGIRARAGVWVRPLLGLRRAETGRYCEEQGLPYAEDRGNLDPAYVRSRLRAEVLPAWEAALPGAVEAAGRTAEVAAEGADLLKRLADELLGELAHADSSSAFGPALSAARLSRLPQDVRRLVLHRFLAGVPGAEPSGEGVAAVDGLLEGNSGRSVNLPGGWVAVRDHQWLRVLPALGAAGVAQAAGAVGAAEAVEDTPPSLPPPTPLPLPGRIAWNGLTITAELVSSYRAPDVHREAYLDADALGLSGGDHCLRVRAFRPGDRFLGLGSPGRRKLQDVMVDLGVPSRLRGRLPLVLCGEELVWIPGYLTAAHGRIGRATTHVLRLAIEGGPVLE